MNQLVITRMRGKNLSAFCENHKIVQFAFEDPDALPLLGDIYIGRVSNIIPNIRAAFIDLGNGLTCYFSLDENKKLLFADGKERSRLRIGDELIVQVVRESTRKKAPSVSCHLSIPGRLGVLTFDGNGHIGISARITDNEWKEKILSEIPPFHDGCGYIIRTNAYQVPVEELLREMEELHALRDEILNKASFRSCYSLIHRHGIAYMDLLRGADLNSLEKILTDREDVYQNIAEYLLKVSPESISKLSLYDDELLPLQKLYRFEKAMDDALREKVWLKSGGSLVIQPTEALVAIDVNTGKAIAGKTERQETFFKINMEAADEIAMQLRLRNLSGIIIVDFIDMESEEMRQKLLAHFENRIKKDPVRTTLVGISKLNLVELTRKKVLRPLYEEMTLPCESCGGTGRIISANS